MKKKLIRTINGQKVQLDRHIADLICLMNENGFKTMWCCSGVKEDHSKNDASYELEGYGRRAYIRCDSKDYTPIMISILLDCLTDIGTLQYNDNGIMKCLDIEFIKIFANKPFKYCIDTFHKRFKEITNVYCIAKV